MNASTVTVHWHNDNQPIYSVDFQPLNSPSKLSEPSPRLVTAGGDNNIRVWKLKNEAGTISIEYLSTLRKHTQAVNVVRFNKNGQMLASAGDDGTLMIWKLADRIIKDFEDDDDADEATESWQVLTQLRSSTSEINDISWSPDSKYLVSGSMDNTLRIYKLETLGDKLTGKLFTSFDNHNHYVQGVYWDPLNEFIASQSADRSVNIYKLLKNEMGEIESIRPLHKFNKIHNHFMYHSETLQSFFRRLCFSPDGSFLLTPAGIENDKSDEPAKKEEGNEIDASELESSSSEKSKQDKADSNTVYIYLRSSLSQSPILKVSGLNKPAIAISFNPIIYQSNPSSLFKLPYKMIFAVATQDSVIIYSTEEFKPLGYVSNLHYSSITDLKWDLDGSRIIVSSTDGFCSVITFDDEIFGKVYEKPTKTNDYKVEEKQLKRKIPEEHTLEPESSKAGLKLPDKSTDLTPKREISVNDGEPIQPRDNSNNTEVDDNHTETNQAMDDEKHPKPLMTIDQLLKKPKTTKKRIAPTLISNQTVL